MRGDPKMVTEVGIIWPFPIITENQAQAIVAAIRGLPQPLGINFPSLLGEGALELEWLCARNGYYMYEWANAIGGPEKRILQRSTILFFILHHKRRKRGGVDVKAWINRALDEKGDSSVYVLLPRRMVTCRVPLKRVKLLMLKSAED